MIYTFHYIILLYPIDPFSWPLHFYTSCNQSRSRNVDWFVETYFETYTVFRIRPALLSIMWNIIFLLKLKVNYKRSVLSYFHYSYFSEGLSWSWVTWSCQILRYLKVSHLLALGTVDYLTYRERVFSLNSNLKYIYNSYRYRTVILYSLIQFVNSYFFKFYSYVL